MMFSLSSELKRNVILKLDSWILIKHLFHEQLSQPLEYLAFEAYIYQLC